MLATLRSVGETFAKNREKTGAGKSNGRKREKENDFKENEMKGI